MQGRISAEFRRIVFKGGVKNPSIPTSRVDAGKPPSVVSVADGLVDDERDFERRYAEYRPKVRALLARKAPWLDSDAREELYQQGWLAVFEARREGRPVENELSFIFAAATNTATELVREADGRRRTTFDPLRGKLVHIADDAPDPGELVILVDEAAVGRSLLARLGPSQRAVALRRYGRGDTPEEICAELGISRARYRKLIEKIGRRLGELVAEYHAGKLTASDELVLARCILGEATDAERELASHLVQTAQGMALLCSVHRAVRKAAMGTPLPAAPTPAVRDQIAVVLEHTKNAVGSAFGRGGASGSEAATNMTVSGSGGKAARIVGAIAACAVGAGGAAGGVCLVTGTTPIALIDKLDSGGPPPAERTQQQVEPPPQAVVAPAPAPPVTTTPPADPPATPPAAETEPPSAPQAAAQEFLYERQQASPSGSNPQPPSTGGSEFSAPHQAAPAPSGSGGSGGEFGFEGGG